MATIRSLPVAILAVALLAPSGAAVAVEDRLPSPRVEWRSLETANFLIVGDASARRMREIGEGLELFRASLLLLKPHATARSPVPTLVLAFSGSRVFRPYGSVGLEPGRQVAGVFHRTTWGNYIVFDTSAGGEDPLAVVQHEYVHFFVATNFPSTPLWLNEGMAEYFSTFRTTSDGIQVGRPVPYHVRELREGWRLPLARLLAIGHTDPEYREGQKVGPFYAQSWLLVHYALVGEPAMAPRLVDLLARLDRGEPLEAAFPAAFGMGFEELEGRLVRYVRQPAFQFRNLAIGDLGRPEIGAPVGISRAEALGLLGEFLAHAGAHDAAREHLVAASELDASHGDVVSLQAYLEQSEGRKEIASQLYTRAAGLTTRRASSFAHAARFALDRAQEAESGSEGRRAALEAALRAAVRGTEIAPDFGEPWALRGLAELRMGDPLAALVSLAEAHRRSPDRVDVVYNRFLASFEADQLAAARGIATGPLRRLDPDLAAEALEQLEWKRAKQIVDAAIAESNRLVAAGEPASAVEPLRSALGRIADPRQREYLESQIDYVERLATDKGRIDEYNRAIERTNASRYGEARAILDELLSDCGDHPVCDAARDLRAQLGDILRRRR